MKFIRSSDLSQVHSEQPEKARFLRSTDIVRYFIFGLFKLKNKSSTQNCFEKFLIVKILSSRLKKFLRDRKIEEFREAIRNLNSCKFLCENGYGFRPYEQLVEEVLEKLERKLFDS